MACDRQGCSRSSIDSGVDYSHEDLADNLLDCPYAHDFAGGGDNPAKSCKKPEDSCGAADPQKYYTNPCVYHGIGMTSIIAGVTNNGKGMASPSYNSRIMHFRVVPGGKEAVARMEKEPAQAINYILSLKKEDRPKVINVSIARKDCVTTEDSKYLFEHEFGQAVQKAVKEGIVVVLASGEKEGCDLSIYHDLAAIDGVILVGAYKLIWNKGKPDLARAPYSVTDLNLTGLTAGGDDKGYYGEPGTEYKELPKFLNRILKAIKAGVMPDKDDVRDWLAKRLPNGKNSDYDWRAGVSPATAFMSSFVAQAFEISPNSSPTDIEKILREVCSKNFLGYDSKKDGCGIIITPKFLAAVEAKAHNKPYIILEPDTLNLGNYYDPDNEGSFKITAKNIGGGQLGKVTREGLKFKNPFKSIVTVDIYSDNSWLKVVDIKTIKEFQEYEITFTFNKSAQAVNKYAINKNPDKIFEGELIVIPYDTNNNAIIGNGVKIPVVLVGGKSAYEEINDEINVFVYDKKSFQKTENPTPVFSTVTSKGKSFEFEIDNIEEGKEYTVVATTNVNWYKGKESSVGAIEYFLGQAEFKNGDACNSQLKIPLYKFTK